MIRDPARFPADPTGDQLWELAAAGVPPEVREVTFTIDCPTITSVAVFIADLEDEFPDRLQDRIAEQTLSVTLQLVLDYETLSAAETELQAICDANDAEMMGWRA